MTLSINFKDGKVDVGFARWLKRRIQYNFYMRLDEKKLVSWDEYLNSSDEFDITYIKHISSKDILLKGINSLVIDTSANQATIHIDHNMLVFGLGTVKLETMCKLINFGDSSHKGYPIFTEVFTDVENNLSSYIDRYVMGGI